MFTSAILLRDTVPFAFRTPGGNPFAPRGTVSETQRITQRIAAYRGQRVGRQGFTKKRKKDLIIYHSSTVVSRTELFARGCPFTHDQYLYRRYILYCTVLYCAVLYCNCTMCWLHSAWVFDPFDNNGTLKLVISSILFGLFGWERERD